MQIWFLEAAKNELNDAIDYYNYEAEDLGEEFLSEVLKALDRIKCFPNAWPSCSQRTKRCLLRRFPYGVIYQIRNEGILVVAIAHSHRKPSYWKDRL